MIDRNKLEYFRMAAWLRGYSEGVKPFDVSEKLMKAADMLDYVFNSEIKTDDNDE